MKMRVSIARALVTRPQLLLMDEPFAALDEITRFKLNDDLLRAVAAATGFTAVFVTHSVFESVFLSQRIVVMTRAAGPTCWPRSPSRRLIRAMRGYRDLGRSTPRIAAVSRRRSTKAMAPCMRKRRCLPLILRPRSCSADGRPPCGSSRSRTYLLPGPVAIARTLVERLADAAPSRWWITLRSRSRPSPPPRYWAWRWRSCSRPSEWVERSLFPYAVILQVTPIVAIAPLIIDLGATTPAWRC